MLTFIFTVVSDFALVPSLTVTAKNRKHFEVFVGTSAILTVRKKKDFSIFSDTCFSCKNSISVFLRHTNIRNSYHKRRILHITRSPPKNQGFLYNACDALDVSLFLSKDDWHRINNVMAITYCALLAIYLMCNDSDDANTVLRYAAFALVTVAQVCDVLFVRVIP